MSSPRRLQSTILVVLISMLAFAMQAKSQTITGSISGTVTDATGGVIPSATVTLASDKTGQTRTAATNGEGRFNFAALQPGTYWLKIEQQGFQSFEQRNIILSANENLALGDLKLQPGQVTETVSIMSEGAIVER
ncbi:MAG TPA: carboxypeptidase-like regulatory domain-containing protein, partial [Pyrinomonadaceae bacterium]|nr:carboxypeptidase-like regulatory domain-containing protein [Pyrinomonadaceae bacterium]